MRGRDASGRLTPEYVAWAAMKSRVNGTAGEANKKHYYDKGIRVCGSWYSSFENFYNDMGPKPSLRHSLDRIDSNGPYCKENCRWADPKMQRRNTTMVRLITYNNKTQCLTAWAEELNIDRRTLWKRIASGWCLENALLQPTRRKANLKRMQSYENYTPPAVVDNL